MKTKQIVIAIALAMAQSMVFGGAALAYVPPSGFILKSLSAKHTGPKGARVRSTVTSIGADLSQPVRFKVVSVYSAELGTVRTTAFDEAGQALYAEEVRLGADGNPQTVVLGLLFDANSARLQETLKRAGVRVRTEQDLLGMSTEEERRASESVRLGRWKKTFAWILSGKEKDSPAQLWVEKDVFLPARFLFNLRDNGNGHEVQFENFRYYSEFPFPRLLTYLEKDQAVLREELTDVQINPSESASSRQPLVPGYTAAGNAASPALKNLLKAYFESLR